MNNPNNVTQLRPVISQRLGEALNLLIRGGLKAGASALEDLPTDKVRLVREQIDAGQAQLTVQIDVPSGDLRVMIDGRDYPQPECLLAVDQSSPVLERIGSA